MKKRRLKKKAKKYPKNFLLMKQNLVIRQKKQKEKLTIILRKKMNPEKHLQIMEKIQKTIREPEMNREKRNMVLSQTFPAASFCFLNLKMIPLGFMHIILIEPLILT